MDDKLIEDYNELVSNVDNVIYLGDVAFCNNSKSIEYINRLNGMHKRLVVGNHDFDNKKIKTMGLEQYGNDPINLLCVYEREHFVIIFTHFPVTNFPEVDDFGRHVFIVHGHTHGNEDESVRHINVSVERTEYKPININSVIDIINSRILEIEG